MSRRDRLPHRVARILVAPDKFKGTLTAIEAADAIGAAARNVLEEGSYQLDFKPIADGGDGTVDAYGGATRTSTVTGPLGEPVEAAWRLDAELAVLESAAACGLALVGGASRNDPWRASSAGVGELIREALESGAKQVIVGTGGVASTDGGSGALESLKGLLPFPAGAVQVLTDTTATFSQAATMFGPQKGADPRMVAALTDRLLHQAMRWRDRFGCELAGIARGGAAGGLSGALYAAGASLLDGAAVIADELRLPESLDQADLVITGEGSFDSTTLIGKGPGEVLSGAARRGLPAMVIAGKVDVDASQHGAYAFSVVDCVGAELAFSDPTVSLRRTAEAALRYLMPASLIEMPARSSPLEAKFIRVRPE